MEKKWFLKPISLTLVSLIVCATYAFAAGSSAEPAAVIDITSVPVGAAIEIDGRAVGEAPLVGITLVAGEYEVKAEMHGLADTTALMNLAAGEEKEVTVYLGPEGGGSLFGKATTFTLAFLVGAFSGAMIAVLLAIAGGSDPGLQ